MKHLRLLIVLGLLSISHSAALAEEPKAAGGAERAEASVHFRRGVEFFQEEAFRAALVEFQRAYEIAPDYRLLYNIGQTKLRLQDYLGSVQSYEAYLTSGGAEIALDRRRQIEASLTSLRERVGRIGVTCNRDGAEVFIDDLKAGETPLPVTVAVNVGRHRVLVRTADGASDTKLVDVAGGDVSELPFELAQAPATAVTATEQPSPPWSAKRKAAVASWSVGGLLLAASAVTGALTWQSQTDFDAALKTEGASSKSISDDRDQLETLALSTDILIGAGAAAVVVGTVLWIVDHRAAKDKRAATARSRRGLAQRPLEILVGTQSVQLRGQF